MVGLHLDHFGWGAYTSTHGGMATDGVDVLHIALTPDEFGPDPDEVLLAVVTAFDTQR